MVVLGANGGVACPSARSLVSVQSCDAACAATPAPVASPDPCQDGTQSGTETDVDCGGRDCGKCPAGFQCAVNTDCGAGLICWEQSCLAPLPANATDSGAGLPDMARLNWRIELSGVSRGEVAGAAASGVLAAVSTALSARVQEAERGVSVLQTHVGLDAASASTARVRQLADNATVLRVDVVVDGVVMADVVQAGVSVEPVVVGELAVRTPSLPWCCIESVVTSAGVEQLSASEVLGLAAGVPEPSATPSPVVAADMLATPFLAVGVLLAVFLFAVIGAIVASRHRHVEEVAVVPVPPPSVV